MRLGKHRAALLLIAALLASALPAAGQGRTPYMNVESPQVHSVELAEVGGHTFLLVCNTPDNSALPAKQASRLLETQSYTQRRCRRS